MILSPAQVARQLGVTLPYIYTLLAAGRLEGERVNGRWQIKQEVVDAWKVHTANRRRVDVPISTPTPEEKCAE